MSKSDETKVQIMRAAVQLFTRLGYEGTGIRAIAATAGVNTGLIRYHFGHKADVYRDTLAFVSVQYNDVCTKALDEVRDGGSAEDVIYSWLAAPITRWQDNSVATGEEVLLFLNRMGYESPELTRGVYESHYSFAIQEWQEVIRSHFPNMHRVDWLWCLTGLRGMYFNIVAHNDFTLWGLPAINSKEPAIRRLAQDTVRLLQIYSQEEE